MQAGWNVLVDRVPSVAAWGNVGRNGPLDCAPRPLYAQNHYARDDKSNKSASPQLPQGSSGFPHREFGRELAVNGGDLPLLQNGVDSLEDDADRHCSHRFHGLAHGG